MKRLPPLLIAVFTYLTCYQAIAQTAPQPQQTIRQTEENSYDLNWLGINNRTYFVQWSTDLIQWNYMPVIESGAGDIIGYGFEGDGLDKMFVRLCYTDDPTNEPYSADFDSDGISNWDEVREGGTGTDPFKWSTTSNGQSDYDADSNGNGLPDGWEASNGNLGDQDPNADEDGDEYTLAEELENGTDPSDPASGPPEIKIQTRWNYSWVEGLPTFAESPKDVHLTDSTGFDTFYLWLPVGLAASVSEVWTFAESEWPFIPDDEQGWRSGLVSTFVESDAFLYSLNVTPGHLEDFSYAAVSETRLHAEWAVKKPISQSFLIVEGRTTEKGKYNLSGGGFGSVISHNETTEILAAETLTLTIPAGETNSATTRELGKLQLQGLSVPTLIPTEVGGRIGTRHYRSLIPVGIVPDYNRDGKIDQQDRGKVTEANPWRWWINDDNDWSSDERGNNDRDFPKQPIHLRDCGDLAIDGMRDLIDFFPLHLDLQKALEIFPAAKYDYLLAHEDEALKFWAYPSCVIDGSSPGHGPNRYFKVIGVARALKTKGLFYATSDGQALSSGLLAQAAQGNGVVVLEGAKKTDKPLILKIVKKSDQSVVAEIPFPIRIVDVEDMYRRVNLRAHMFGTGGALDQASSPADYPDSLTNGKYFAYIHGFNVSGESAQGSGSNIFKRMHQMGSKARYVAISWYGDPPSPVPAGGLNNDYHRAVYNALKTGEILNNGLNFTHGAELTIAAHSLGNMVVSHAIAHHGLRPTNYIMIDGAVAIQAYDSGQEYGSSFTGPSDKMEIRMVEDDWKPYQTRLYATNWHQLFPATDSRSNLTWKDYFSTDLNGNLSSEVLSVAHNFYSRGDDVVENPEISEQFGDDFKDDLWTLIPGGVHVKAALARHAWVNQEIAKGGQNPITLGVFHDLNGGWEFNFQNAQYFPGVPPPQGYFEWDTNPNGPTFSRKYTPVEAAAITNAQLKQKPFFKPFLFPDLHDPIKGSDEAAKKDVLYKTLATGIPASSYATACNAIDKLNFPDETTRNYKMQENYKNGWIETAGSEGDDWLHSDFKDITLTYVYPMYAEMINIGKLNEN